VFRTVDSSLQIPGVGTYFVALMVAEVTVSPRLDDDGFHGLTSGRSAIAHWRAALAILVLIWPVEGARAQEAVSRAAPSPPPSMATPPPQADNNDNPTDGAGWRQRLEAARRRHADWLACIAAKWPDCSPTPAPDPMEPLLNDQTLVKGDIVSTPHGLKVFRGQSTVPHSLTDFQ
jgi:hypothetical protein